MGRKKVWAKVEWEKAPDVKLRIKHLKSSLNLDWLKINSVHCFRSQKSSARAYARVWGLSRIWQQALDIEPAYIIEVLSEKYDRLSQKQKDEILLHEIAHIPKNFSGSLLPHIRTRGKRNFNDRVRELVKKHRKGY